MAINEVKSLIFLVIVVLVGTTILFAVAPYLQKASAQFFPGQNKESSDFQNAMKCAYYRCTNGCDSDQVKSLTATWADPQTRQDVSCSDFCQPGKSYCGADSVENPVRIDIGEKAFLAQDKLKAEFGTDCIISSDFHFISADLGTAILTVGVDILGAQLSYLFSLLTKQNIADLRILEVSSPALIDPDSIQYQRVDCYKAATKIGENAMSSLSLVPGKYQISMGHAEALSIRFDKIFIGSYQKAATPTTATTTR